MSWCPRGTMHKGIKPMNTKRKVTLALVALGMAATAPAQTYMDHLRQDVKGKGSVVVTQSKEIDDLVNGGGKAAAPGKPSATEGQDKNATAPKGGATAVVPGKSVQEPTPDHEAEAKAEAARREAEARRLAENKAREAARAARESAEGNATTVDTRKKVMRGSRKVTGYRVQAFAGGNTRDDKQRAQQIGNAIKMKFPDQPIYVHFYSPRWICRVGNFRSYQEAQSVLKQVRAMGYKSATIVKGQITVQY